MTQPQPQNVEQVRKARRKLAMRIADAIAHQWPALTVYGYDQEHATDIVEQLIPLTYSEMEAEIATLSAGKPGASVVVKVAQLQRALGMKAGTIGETIDAALKQITGQKGSQSRS